MTNGQESWLHRWNYYQEGLRTQLGLKIMNVFMYKFIQLHTFLKKINVRSLVIGTENVKSSRDQAS